MYHGLAKNHKVERLTQTIFQFRIQGCLLHRELQLHRQCQCGVFSAQPQTTDVATLHCAHVGKWLPPPATRDRQKLFNLNVGMLVGRGRLEPVAPRQLRLKYIIKRRSYEVDTHLHPTRAGGSQVRRGASVKTLIVHIQSSLRCVLFIVNSSNCRLLQ